MEPMTSDSISMLRFYPYALQFISVVFGIAALGSACAYVLLVCTECYPSSSRRGAGQVAVALPLIKGRSAHVAGFSETRERSMGDEVETEISLLWQSL